MSWCEKQKTKKKLNLERSWLLLELETRIVRAMKIKNTTYVVRVRIVSKLDTIAVYWFSRCIILMLIDIPYLHGILLPCRPIIVVDVCIGATCMNISRKLNVRL